MTFCFFILGLLFGGIITCAASQTHTRRYNRELLIIIRQNRHLHPACILDKLQMRIMHHKTGLL